MLPVLKSEHKPLKKPEVSNLRSQPTLLFSYSVMDAEIFSVLKSEQLLLTMAIVRTTKTSFASSSSIPFGRVAGLINNTLATCWTYGCRRCDRRCNRAGWISWRRHPIAGSGGNRRRAGQDDERRRNGCRQWRAE